MALNMRGLNAALEALATLTGQTNMYNRRLKGQEAMSMRLGEASLGRSEQLARLQSQLRTTEREGSAGLTRETDRLRHIDDIELAALKTKDIIRQQDPDNYFFGKLQVLDSEGRTEEANRLKQEAMPGLLKAAEAGILMSEGKSATPQQVVDKLLVSGGERTDQALRQSGTRAGQIRGQDVSLRGQDITKRGQDITKRGQDVTLRGQEITARGQEIGQGKEYQAYIKDIRKEALAFLDKVLKEKEDYVSTTESTGETDLSGKAKDSFEAGVGSADDIDVMSKGDIRHLMTRVNQVANKAKSGKLNDKDMNLLLNVYNLESSIIPGGQVGEVIGRPGQAEIPQQPQETVTLTPEEKREIYYNRLIQKGVTPEEADRMAKLKYGF